MPKQMYCSYCGMELKHKPIALKNRAEIIYTVDPHDCDEQYVANITDSDKPESDFAKELAEKERAADAADQQRSDDSLLAGTPDRRSPDHKRKPLTSSAPAGILGTVKNGMPESTPARQMVDLDDKKEGEESEG